MSWLSSLGETFVQVKDVVESRAQAYGRVLQESAAQIGSAVSDKAKKLLESWYQPKQGINMIALHLLIQLHELSNLGYPIPYDESLFDTIVTIVSRNDKNEEINPVEPHGTRQSDTQTEKQKCLAYWNSNYRRLSNASKVIEQAIRNLLTTLRSTPGSVNHEIRRVADIVQLALSIPQFTRQEHVFVQDDAIGLSFFMPEQLKEQYTKEQIIARNRQPQPRDVFGFALPRKTRVCFFIQPQECCKVYEIVNVSGSKLTVQPLDNQDKSRDEFDRDYPQFETECYHVYKQQILDSAVRTDEDEFSYELQQSMESINEIVNEPYELGQQCLGHLVAVANGTQAISIDLIQRAYASYKDLVDHKKDIQTRIQQLRDKLTDDNDGKAVSAYQGFVESKEQESDNLFLDEIPSLLLSWKDRLDDSSKQTLYEKLPMESLNQETRDLFRDWIGKRTMTASAAGDMPVRAPEDEPWNREINVPQQIVIQHDGTQYIGKWTIENKSNKTICGCFEQQDKIRFNSRCKFVKINPQQNQECKMTFTDYQPLQNVTINMFFDYIENVQQYDQLTPEQKKQYIINRIQESENIETKTIQLVYDVRVASPAQRVILPDAPQSRPSASLTPTLRNVPVQQGNLVIQSLDNILGQRLRDGTITPQQLHGLLKQQGLLTKQDRGRTTDRTLPANRVQSQTRGEPSARGRQASTQNVSRLRSASPPTIASRSSSPELLLSNPFSSTSVSAETGQAILQSGHRTKNVMDIIDSPTASPIPSTDSPPDSPISSRRGSFATEEQDVQVSNKFIEKNAVKFVWQFE